MSKQEVKLKIIPLVGSLRYFTSADLAMELQTPLLRVLEGLLELESEHRIEPISDALRRGEGTEPIRLTGEVLANVRQGETLEASDVEEILRLAKERCFLFEAGRMEAYRSMLQEAF